MELSELNGAAKHALPSLEARGSDGLRRMCLRIRRRA